MTSNTTKQLPSIPAPSITEQCTCIACGKKLHNNEYPLDSSNSPLVAEDYGYHGDDIDLCFVCNNFEPAYTRGLTQAKKQWERCRCC